MQRPIVIALIVALMTLLAPSGAGAEGAPTPTLPNFKVAFLADEGVNANAQAVLQLVLAEGADMVLVQGDLGYGDETSPQSAIDWDNQVTAVLGADYPLFASVGNHDVAQWATYQQLFQNRLNLIPGATCSGDLGVQAACHFGGLFFLLTGPGTLGSGHEAFIQQELAADDSVWSVCSWHKNMKAMQVGSNFDETGWGVYQECRKGGGIIATGHEHSYHRTRTLTNPETQQVDPAFPTHDTLSVGNGSTFVSVSGLGGLSIRAQKRCKPPTFPYGCNGEWASIYTKAQKAAPGALFIEFNVGGDPRAATGYFKDINGSVIDTFTATAPTVTRTVLGSVSVSVTGDAVEGVSVSLDSGVSRTTDSTGNYRIDNAALGVRTVTAEKVGYETQTQQGTVTDDGGTTVVDLSIVSLGVGKVKGLITDAATGKKLGGAFIEADTGQSDTTNNGGRYVLHGVPGGERLITASKAGYITQTKTVTVVNGLTTITDFQLVPQ